ncbi:DUF1007 family protein [Yoonia sp. R2331]|uniref:DUF1007 family protein n=1 Tax=Yoonia sp. R2331 TaxID=3237238 RepID=UPI0034E3951A
MRTPLCIAALALTLTPPPALAHPHIFVGAEVTVDFSGSTPVVRLAWVYDDYFSLLITADLGLDLDGDMRLTPAEVQTLAASVTAWPPDFQGDLEVMQGDTLLGLAPKQDHTMTFEDGLVREMHSRAVTIADPAAPLNIRVYDPFYYVAYQLAAPVQITGRDDCTAAITPPNLDRAYSLVEELLYGRPAGDVGPDEEFPEVGVEFAETITVTCAAPL